MENIDNKILDELGGKSHKEMATDLLTEMREMLHEMRVTRDFLGSEGDKRARNWAVAITDYEKVYAYFKTFVVDGMG